MEYQAKKVPNCMLVKSCLPMIMNTSLIIFGILYATHGQYLISLSMFIYQFVFNGLPQPIPTPFSSITGWGGYDFIHVKLTSHIK